jgi:hypothetical protein
MPFEGLAKRELSVMRVNDFSSNPTIELPTVKITQVKQ